jgi:hypothetical protein
MAETLKRPENGAFQPHSHFQAFFAIARDTDNRSGSQPQASKRLERFLS